jgi:hypothetical protein
MHATQIDTMWFQANPSREYRLRRQAPVHPGPDFDPWCIIRRSDGAMEVFALKTGDTWDDHDLELEQFFDSLREAA